MNDTVNQEGYKAEHDWLPGAYCNNFNLLELIWYEFRKRTAETPPPSHNTALWPWRTLRWAMFSGLALGSLLTDLEKRGTQKGAGLSLLCLWGGNKQKYLP